MEVLIWIGVIVFILWLVGRRRPPQTSRSAPPTPPRSRRRPRTRPERKPTGSQVEPAEILLGDDAPQRGYAIPKRQSETTSIPVGNGVTLRVEVKSYGPGTSFLEDARRFVNRTHGKAPHAPFQSYWSTYRDMSKEQAQWYFYWRHQLRQGTPLPTDLSYLFIHIYECLHCVGFDQAEDAYQHLLHLWESYREQHPKLDTYLQTWLLDMNAYYELGYDPLDLVNRMSRQGVRVFEQDLLIAAWLKTRDYDALTPSLLSTLAGFDPRSGKFYKEFEHRALIDQTLRLAFQAVDVHFQSTTGQGVFEAHQPKRLKTIKRSAFAGAVFDYQSKHVLIAKVPAYSGLKKLPELLESALKLAENILRKQVGFAGQRRGIELPAELEAYLRRVLGSKDTKPVAKPIPRREVHIDLEKVKGLQSASSEIRAQLIPDAHHAEAMRPQSQRFELPVDTPPGQLTDVDRVADILDQLTPAGLALLHSLNASGWEESVTAPAELQLVNQHSQAILGEHLVTLEGDRLVLEDDYRDELAFLLARREYAAPASTPTQQPSAGPGAAEPLPEWLALKNDLSALHLQVLGKVLTGCSQAELEGFATEHFTMGSLLVEEINEHAVEAIGDNLVDSYEDPLVIYDEHHDLVRAMVGA